MNFIRQLARILNEPEDLVESTLSNGPQRYKTYHIPKRTHGFRLIAQPSKNLKIYQRAFLELVNFPIHKCALAYREKLSIKDNAIAHMENSYLLKLDLENFFNSITPELLWSVWDCFQFFEVNKQDKIWVEKLLFWELNSKLVLSVGAPSSPVISNFCMYIFDDAIATYCSLEGITYTRYADDLTFSTNKKGALFTLPLKVEEILRDCFDNQLVVNKSKTVFSSKAHNRHVTGITLTNEGAISLGRSKKRLIKHKVHQFSLGKLSDYEVMHLKGLLAFSRHIEPVFFESLYKKYSKKLIQNIFEANNE